MPITPKNIRQRAVQSMFDHLASMCEGLVAVDRDVRIAWMDDKYKALLGVDYDVTGRIVEEVIPNSLMRQVVTTGKPILLDIMDFGSRSFVVIRLPLLDEEGSVTGGIGLVLFDRAEYLKPLFFKFSKLQEELTRTRRELAGERQAKYTFTQFLGTSEAVRQVKTLARRAAQMDSTVLLMGETGTGKELLAHAIHAASARSRKPMVSINVAAVPEALLEAEFFGVAPGAYTGADPRGRDGKFHLANGGTLFLDEIGDMPLVMQTKLLRALQEKEIEPLGSNKVVRVDVRIIAATSRDLATLVRANLFRADLFYRINVVPILLPPLRERIEDIDVLAENFLDCLRLKTGEGPRELDRSALAMLKTHDWPGNVRELHNILERACTLSEVSVLTAGDFAPILPGCTLPRATEPLPVLRLATAVSQAERAAITAALAQADGNKSAAAKLLEISRASLYERMAALGLTSDGTDTGPKATKNSAP
ncbi:sigma 54-interacting transcriptional regulator [Telmatospirillum sp.]|uniref:sigma-54 interaction domain-containing protein n=1 Tax=Telmatospirillum sp. TaxID=2079197 RepID=UPI00284F161E|nr:sigma 54-interacting transcriptional regulator [Telmatospirillum sp.]MDR3438396.1 sigma 54-interacting transcriptional regulator [Telmatospirillum sp.]